MSLERLALHYGMLDRGQLNAIAQDKAYGRGVHDLLDFLSISASTAQGPEKNALGRFLAAAQKRFAKFAYARTLIYPGVVGIKLTAETWPRPARPLVPMC